MVPKRLLGASLGVPGPARTPLGSPRGSQSLKTSIFLMFFDGWSQKPCFSLCFLRVDPKMRPHFGAKGAKIAVLYSLFGPLGVLSRIQRIHYFSAEMSHSRQNRPWVPHAGGQDDGSLRKLPQISARGRGTLRQGSAIPPDTPWAPGPHGPHGPHGAP